MLLQFAGNVDIFVEALWFDSVSVVLKQETGLETGLPEVGWQDSMPSNFTRDPRANIFALEEFPEGTWQQDHAQNE